MTHNHLCSLNIHGDTPIEKDECINHVANRVGTALRKLSTQSKKKGVTLGGRGHGKLTHSAITKLRGYYGTAIRAHPMTRRQTIHSTTAALMAKQVGASSGVQRRLVPFQALITTKSARHYHQRLRLAWTRCMWGSAIPLFSSLPKIWAKCPKTRFIGLERVAAVSCAAIVEVNSGVELSQSKLCEEMSIESGSRLLVSAKKAMELCPRRLLGCRPKCQLCHNYKNVSHYTGSVSLMEYFLVCQVQQL